MAYSDDQILKFIGQYLEPMYLEKNMGPERSTHVDQLGYGRWSGEFFDRIVNRGETEPQATSAIHSEICRILGVDPATSWPSTYPPPPIPEQPLPGKNWREARGLFRLHGKGFKDDNGPFPALSATFFNAQTLYVQDKARLDKNLEFCRTNGVDIVRVLCYTDWNPPRNIDFNPDLMSQVIRYIWENYNIRTEVSIFGSTYFGNYDEAVAQLGITLAGLAEAIAFFEIANEPHNHNAANLPVEKLQHLATILRPYTKNLIALGSPLDIQAEVEDFIKNADLTTPHYDRKNDTPEGNWRPIRQPWEGKIAGPPCCNNEPIGPGSSVETLDDPKLQMVAANCSWTANNGVHCWHSKSGVGNDEDTPLGTEPGLETLTRGRALLPLDIASWDAQNWHWEANPFVTEEGSCTDNGMNSRGTIRTITCLNGSQFVCHPFGIPVGATLRAKQNLEFKFYGWNSGAKKYEVIGETRLNKDQRFDLKAADDYFLIGRLL